MVAEGANLAVDIKAISYMEKHHIMYGPGKAANAGGVIVSALEIEQNKTFTQWPSEVVDQKLKHIMETLFLRIYEASNHKKEHFMTGANRLAFEKILEAMILRGLY
jgi:glutamate dehydrogenase (NADP+)